MANKDWVILLEAGTMVPPSPQGIRVARYMQERNILMQSDMWRFTQFTSAHTLVPLLGKEIAELIARFVQAGAVERCPWYVIAGISYLVIVAAVALIAGHNSSQVTSPAKSTTPSSPTPAIK